MLAQNIENGFSAIRGELKEKEFELLRELNTAIKEESAKILSNSAKLICRGRAQAYLSIYEKFFGTLRKNKDGSLDVANLQHKIKSVLKELKEFLGA